MAASGAWKARSDQAVEALRNLLMATRQRSASGHDGDTQRSRAFLGMSGQRLPIAKVRSGTKLPWSQSMVERLTEGNES